MEIHWSGEDGRRKKNENRLIDESSERSNSNHIFMFLLF